MVKLCPVRLNEQTSLMLLVHSLRMDLAFCIGPKSDGFQCAFILQSSQEHGNSF